MKNVLSYLKNDGLVCLPIIITIKTRNNIFTIKATKRNANMRQYSFKYVGMSRFHSLPIQDKLNVINIPN